MYVKNHDAWNCIKKEINNKEQKSTVRPGEIRWMFCGVNVGSEIDGKGSIFSRPALIVDTIGTNLALVIPMSSKTHDRAGYIPFLFNTRPVSLCIHQMRVVSQKRFFRRIYKVSEDKLREVKHQVTHFYHLYE